MRTASMVLGIVGGAIALILAIFLFMGSSFIASVPWSDSSWDYSNNYEDSFNLDDWNDDYSSAELDDLLDNLNNYDSDYADSLAGIPETVQNLATGILLVPAICAAIAGVLGLVGGLIVKKSNVAAGVMMIVAAVLSLISLFNIISMALFIVGGVFALMRDRSKQQGYVPPYPMPPNYAYPQQPYPQQPYAPPVYPPQPEQPQQPASPPNNPPENPQL